MNNSQSLEPQAYGSIIFKTTFGDLDIELFTKQCPKVTKNFVQFCLDGYYDQAKFHRVEKDFIAVAGEFEDHLRDTCSDEFHPRLKFTRRGLLATANTKKDDNGPEIFFTLGPTQELQKKHTIFGRVKGFSLFNLVSLNDCEVDDEFKPCIEQVITDVLISENPYPELEARLERKQELKTNPEPDESSSDDDPLLRQKPDPTKVRSLSFYPDDNDDDDEDDNDECGKETEQVSTKAADSKTQILDQNTEPDEEKSFIVRDQPRIANALTDSDESVSTNNPAIEDDEEALESVPEELDRNSAESAKEKRLKEIRAKIQIIKDQFEHGNETKTASQRRQHGESSQETHQAPVDDSQIRIALRKGRNREKETVELVMNFRKRLKEADSSRVEDRHEPKIDMFIDDMDGLDKVDGDDWLKHRFEAEDDIRLAKDANTKDDTWYSIEDPRCSMNRRYHRDKHDRHQSNKSTRRYDDSSRKR